MEFQFVIGFLRIAATDLVLAGDNTVIIAMVARRRRRPSGGRPWLCTR
jgi:predicted tellurium resistance membrane protein TerC